MNEGTTTRGLFLIAAGVLSLSACGLFPTGPSDDLRIMTDQVADARVGKLYSEGIDAEGGDGGYSWTVVEGAFPLGLEAVVGDLSDGDLLIRGIPEAQGVFSFTLEVTSDDGQVARASFELSVLPPSAGIQVGNLSLPPTTVGLATEIPLRLAEDTSSEVTWEVVEGSLPPGLSLEGSRITGVPSTQTTTSFSVRASSDGETAARSFTLRVVPNDRTGYHLTLFPVMGVPPSVAPHLEVAVRRWESVLDGDLEGGTIPPDFFGPEGCGSFGEEANGAAVDDVLVLLHIDSIDGAGSVLAQAGPCAVRGEGLPFAGVLTLDSEDVLPLTGTEALTHIVSHELGHVLGYGGLWSREGLLDGAGSDDPRFTGSMAVEEWQDLGGSGAVPVENEGGEGTAESHIRESVFDEELMTGFAEPLGVDQPLSRVSVAAMGDLGYTVRLDAAEPYSLDAPAEAPSTRDPARPGWGEVLMTGPFPVLDFEEER